MTQDWNCLIYERFIWMIVHTVCTFDDHYPEEASALGIKPERFDRPSETTESHPRLKQRSFNTKVENVQCPTS